MVAGSAAALLWQALRSSLPAPWSGVHGFLVGVSVALVVIVVGTWLGRPAKRERIERAWGEGD
jgi:hypothetical protein